MKVTITGASGFVGTNLQDYLKSFFNENSLYLMAFSKIEDTTISKINKETIDKMLDFDNNNFINNTNNNTNIKSTSGMQNKFQSLNLNSTRICWKVFFSL